MGVNKRGVGRCCDGGGRGYGGGAQWEQHGILGRAGRLWVGRGGPGRMAGKKKREHLGWFPAWAALRDALFSGANGGGRGGAQGGLPRRDATAARAVCVLT